MSLLITSEPAKWLLELLYNANKADYETYRVYACLTRYFNDRREFIGVTEEVVPGILRFKPLTDLADDCFFSILLSTYYWYALDGRYSVGSPYSP